MDIASQEQSVCLFDWLCKADFSGYFKYCHGTLYGIDGTEDEKGGFYICRSGERPEKWTDNVYLYCHGSWLIALGYPDDCTGMELFQAVTGNGGEVCRGRGSMLYVASRFFHGGFQNDGTGF